MMLRSILLLMLVLMLYPLSTLGSPPPEVEWSKTFGGAYRDFGNSVAQTSDGGFIVAGGAEPHGLGSTDVSLIKTDSSGALEWYRTFGGSDPDWSNSVAQTSDGGYILTGVTSSNGSAGGDLWLIKTDPVGIVEWVKTFGGSGSDFGNSVEETSDGGFIITGATGSYGSGSLDLWLIKTDSLGSLEWNRTFGGSDSDNGLSVQETGDGGFIVTGVTHSPGSGSGDLWLIKTDSQGFEEWNRTFGGSGADWGSSVRETTDGGFIIAGETESKSSGSCDLWLIRTDSQGFEEWNRTFGGSGDDWGWSVEEASDGGFIVTGWTYSYGSGSGDVWLIKTDSLGSEVWSRTIGGAGDDWGRSVQEAADGGFIIAGKTGTYGQGDVDIWLIKVGSTEEFQKEAEDEI